MLASAFQNCLHSLLAFDLAHYALSVIIDLDINGEYFVEWLIITLDLDINTVGNATGIREFRFGDAVLNLSFHVAEEYRRWRARRQIFGFRVLY